LKVDGRDPQNREKKILLGGEEKVYVGDKALMRESPAQRGRSNRYEMIRVFSLSSSNQMIRVFSFSSSNQMIRVFSLSSSNQMIRDFSLSSSHNVNTATEIYVFC
jgi:hypothetical protein